MTNVEKTMDKYTIYCTPEQTKKALELGAPIEYKEVTDFEGHLLDYEIIDIPTAEEMIGWLEEQGLNINIAYNPFDEVKIIVTECSGYKEIANIKWNKIRKEATLAAIDAALENLISNKK